MAKNITSKSINDEILLVWDLSSPNEALEQFEKMLEVISVEDRDPEDQEDKDPLSQVYRGQILTQVARAQGLVNDFDAAHDSLGEAEMIVKITTSISASDYLVKQELAVLRVRIELERGRVFNSSGDAASSNIHFSKALRISSCGTEDNIESPIMERDTKDVINGLSEEKFVTSDPVCST